MTWHLLSKIHGSWQDVDSCFASTRNTASEEFETRHPYIFQFQTKILSELECKGQPPIKGSGTLFQGALCA
jgi:hypothetical protein